MLFYPHIDPVAFRFGPLQVHWYGLMYLFGIGSAWLLMWRRALTSAGRWNTEQVADLVVYVALGIILGGRLGYVIFYAFQSFVHNPLMLFRVWEGGMSFHGGLLGVMVAMGLFAYRQKKHVLIVSDFVAPLVPIGLGFGRLGNFINGELWGRVTTMPWGMVFPHVDQMPRHPSQLYECALEGALLFGILWWYSAGNRPVGRVSSLFLVLYGVLRFAVEFFRMPDAQMGFLAWGWLTMGQLLSVPMILGGLLLWFYRYE